MYDYYNAKKNVEILIILTGQRRNEWLHGLCRGISQDLDPASCIWGRPHFLRSILTLYALKMPSVLLMWGSDVPLHPLCSPSPIPEITSAQKIKGFSNHLHSISENIRCSIELWGITRGWYLLSNMN